MKNKQTKKKQLLSIHKNKLLPLRWFSIILSKAPSLMLNTLNPNFVVFQFWLTRFYSKNANILMLIFISCHFWFFFSVEASSMAMKHLSIKPTPKRNTDITVFATPCTVLSVGC